MKRTYRICLKFVCVMLLLSSCCLVFAQNNWTGQAQCQLSVQVPNYSYNEVQTWTITGMPDANNAMVYPATWSVTGQGANSSTSAQVQIGGTWQTNVSATSAPLKIFVNSANQLIIGTYHAQLGIKAAVTGNRSAYIKGIESDVPISETEYEWQFPQIEVDSTKTDVSNTSSTPVTSRIAPFEPPGSVGTANCSWHFIKGTPSSASSGVNNPQMTPSNAATPSTGSPTMAPPNLSLAKPTSTAAIMANAASNLKTTTPQGSAISCSRANSIPAIPTSPTSVAASHAYNTSCLMPFSGNQWTPVAKMSLPQGHYVFMATVAIQNFSAANTIGAQQYSCNMLITSGQSATPVGSTSGSGPGQTAIVGLTINGVATGVEVDCAAEANMSASATTSIVAIEAGALN